MPTVSRRRQHGAEIGPAGLVDRGRHGDDVEIRSRPGRPDRRRRRRFGCARSAGSTSRVRSWPARNSAIALAVDVEADDRGAGAREGYRDRQADIAEADDRNVSSVRQCKIPLERLPKRIALEICARPRAAHVDQVRCP